MAAAGSSHLLRAALALACASCTSIHVDSRTFEGTRWQVVAIGPAATPRTDNYVIRFADGQIGGQFGCNHFGGSYRLSGETLSTAAMIMTEMACAGPADEFEQSGMAVLSQPMRLHWISGRDLVLSNPAGAIRLQPRR